MEDKEERDFASEQAYRRSGEEKEIAGSRRHYNGAGASKGIPGNRLETNILTVESQIMSVFQGRPEAKTIEAEGFLTQIPQPVTTEHPPERTGDP